MYLQCLILKEAKLHLCDLETSQGPKRGARRSKQCPPVALWTGNEETDQSRAQKAASGSNWKGGAGGYAPLIRGNTCHFCSGKLNTVYVSNSIDSKITKAAKMCRSHTDGSGFQSSYQYQCFRCWFCWRLQAYVPVLLVAGCY